MSDLTLLLRRMNQRRATTEASHLEDAATTTLAVMIGLIALASLL